MALLESTLYFAFISNDIIPLLYVGFFFNVITFSSNLMLPESPQWLVSQKQYDRARQALMTIAFWNGVEVYELALFKQEVHNMSERSKYIVFN